MLFEFIKVNAKENGDCRLVVNDPVDVVEHPEFSDDDQWDHNLQAS